MRPVVEGIMSIAFSSNTSENQLEVTGQSDFLSPPLEIPFNFSWKTRRLPWNLENDDISLIKEYKCVGTINIVAHTWKKEFKWRMLYFDSWFPFMAAGSLALYTKHGRVSWSLEYETEKNLTSWCARIREKDAE